MATRPSRRWLWITASLIICLGVGAATLLVLRWPFRREALIKSLEDASGGQVRVARVRNTYFPPGSVAEEVSIHRPDAPGARPLVAVRRMVVEADWSSLLTFSHRIESIRIAGMKVFFANAGWSGKPKKSKHTLSIGELVAADAVLEWEPNEPSSEPFQIAIHHARLAPIIQGRALSWETALQLSEPPGEVRASGHFGPWSTNDPFASPVSGSYTLTGADLDFTRGVRGVLDSRGTFKGDLRHIQVHGETATPQFEVANAGHPVDLRTGFDAVVNGQTGEVTLSRVDARFARTEVSTAGVIESRDGVPLPVDLSTHSGEARVEDLLRLFSKAPPGMIGAVSLAFRVTVRSGPGRFIEKLGMSGDFRIRGARFSSESTQEDLERLSERSLGAKVENDEVPAQHASDVEGHLELRDGVTRFTRGAFRVPGISARFGGTYRLTDEAVDLRGLAHLDRRLSDETSGIKSVFARFLNPLFKNRRSRGSTVPVKVTGRNGHASVGIDYGGSH